MNAGEHSPRAGAANGADASGVHWRDSLRTRIALWSGLMAVAVVVVLTLAMAAYLRRDIAEDARLDTLANARQAAEHLDTMMHTLAVTTDGMSLLAADTALEPSVLSDTLRALIEATPGCVGGLLALEPRGPGGAPHAGYVGLDVPDRDFIAMGYDYRAQAWFQKTLESREGWWSEPYLNETAGDVWMVTYNAALWPDGADEARGMVSLDLPLTTLTDDLQTLAHLPGWRVTLVAPDGTLALHPEIDVTRETRTVGELAEAFGRDDLAPAIEAIRQHRSFQMAHADANTGEQRFTVVEPVGDSGWSLLVSQSHALMAAKLNEALLWLAAGGIVLSLLCTLLVRRLARRIAQPVRRLSASAAQLANGDYETPVADTRRRDEVGVMARTLEHARTSIQRQLTEIEEMGAARQKLESELSIARDIQLAMLPPGRVIDRADHHLEAYAQLEPAKAVGGDFYSFVELADGDLWFAIGDVSDKGVPAALFMARSTTVLEVAARASGDPPDVLARASRRLVEGNDTCMFATVLCGRINVRTGDCVLASAGHDPPVLLHPDGRIETLEVETGPPLGFEVSADFPRWEGRLEPGMTLLAYTDGVTEAFDAGNVAFGMEGMIASIGAGRDARDQCEHLIADVHAYAHPAAQDDITVLAIRLRQDAPHLQEEAPC
ncbi:SpoIIE family protein phosphatase [Marilutibacter spongiae]|uniref:SpoIIE family protein phosphatase n=1 Tax=Marilutibacter spongiae TaxID=2025720 RepID=A0A7W3TMV9_9GAMM|nr:SpoIIE family protein phosphatase [Lysobacter spongiae]MBB1061257.1 SpoIIE family protein phosphatase [Lysobacter spongiae]